MSNRISKTDREESIRNLRKLLRPGMTVYTILRHCSASGMSRVIGLVIPVKEYRDEYPKAADGSTDYDAKPRRVYTGIGMRAIGWNAARAMGDTFDHKHKGIKVGGCGMDMGFALVYNLGATLWPKGTRKPHGTRNGEPDTAGGYALNHRWL
jgi:hypothetical protein